MDAISEQYVAVSNELTVNVVRCTTRSISVPGFAFLQRAVAAAAPAAAVPAAAPLAAPARLLHCLPQHHLSASCC